VPLLLNADLLTCTNDMSLCPGLHCSSRTLAAVVARPKARLNLRGDMLLGYSAHTVEEARDAVLSGAQFVTIGPVFDTPSKQGVLSACGVGVIAQTRLAVPDAAVVALGGLNESNAAQAMRAGADGIAVVRAIMNAPDPRAAAARLRDIVGA